MKRKLTVAVAMSGGVDSSTAAALLLEAGYDVFGLTMVLHGPAPVATPGPCGERDLSAVDSARAAAAHLGIPHLVADFRRSFDRGIVRYFCEEYLRGRTPNPCVRCNRRIKFGRLRRKAAALGADFLATGHYARVEKEARRRLFVLKKGKDVPKDQSYFLYTLKQDDLAGILFPLGGLKKQAVRSTARRMGLPVAERRESQEICFIPGDDYHRFLETRVPDAFRPGPVVDLSGRFLGEHQGIARFTIGQRRGLGIPGAAPFYVLSIDAEGDRIIVGPDEALKKTRLEAVEVNWVSGVSPEGPFLCRARIRYRHPESPSKVIPLGPHRVLVEFREPQRAVTPGQAVVFYRRDEVLGGGTIVSARD